jgi:hypothetical protein
MPHKVGSSSNGDASLCCWLLVVGCWLLIQYVKQFNLHSSATGLIEKRLPLTANATDMENH